MVLHYKRILLNTFLMYTQSFGTFDFAPRIIIFCIKLSFGNKHIMAAILEECEVLVTMCVQHINTNWANMNYSAWRNWIQKNHSSRFTLIRSLKKKLCSKHKRWNWWCTGRSNYPASTVYSLQGVISRKSNNIVEALKNTLALTW